MTPTSGPGRVGRLLKVHARDSVAVALEDLVAGEVFEVDGRQIAVMGPVPRGHKVALIDMQVGEVVMKYGYPIGVLREGVRAGAWVHEHNLTTRLHGAATVPPEPMRVASGSPLSAGPAPSAEFLGYRRSGGRVATRNELWIVGTVGCVNRAAERIAEACRARLGARVDGIQAFGHPFGCSQLGDDLNSTRRLLAGLIQHPNAGGVLLIGLGCESNQLQAQLDAAPSLDRSRVRYFRAQDVEDEIEAGIAAAAELVERMSGDRREACSVADLVIGVKCGGSDAFSGLTANPLVGRVTDRVTALGGTAIMTEIPEIFGAEQLLAARAVDSVVREQFIGMVAGFKEYFARHDQPVHENPSPGNKAGGITTLEEKSLGAVQKGGQATITEVLEYGRQSTRPGLAVLNAPGNDAVSATALVAAGATVLLFTTGRGTPLGCPVPTVKISSNSEIARRKPQWIDFDAGSLLDGALREHLADALFELVLDVASGRRLARNEEHGYRDIAIWKTGVTL